MEYEKLMEEIIGGLTGRKDEDVSYLMGQMAKYKDHEFHDRITKDCVKLMTEIMNQKDDAEDDEEEKKFEEEMKDAGTSDARSLKIPTVLKHVDHNIEKQNFQKACDIIEDLVKKIEVPEILGQDEKVESYNFDELFEQILFQSRQEEGKQVCMAMIPYSAIYYRYGLLLFQLERYEEAEKALRKAKKWNPVSAGIANEYNELYLVSGDVETFYQETLKTFRIAFHREDISKCYAGMGYYFVEKELWLEAIVCYLYSLQYDPENENAMYELDYINKKASTRIETPDLAKITASSEKYGFPLTVDKEILSLLYANGTHMFEQKKYEAAKYLFTLYEDLTGDEEVKKILDTIEKI